MQGQQLKINKIFFLTYPRISYILPAVREERVGGTHPVSLQLWLVHVGGAHPYKKNKNKCFLGVDYIL